MYVTKFFDHLMRMKTYLYNFIVCICKLEPNLGRSSCKKKRVYTVRYKAKNLSDQVLIFVSFFILFILESFELLFVKCFTKSVVADKILFVISAMMICYRK